MRVVSALNPVTGEQVPLIPPITCGCPVGAANGCITMLERRHWRDWERLCLAVFASRARITRVRPPRGGIYCPALRQTITYGLETKSVTARPHR